MKIGIDARFYNQSGVGRYLRNLITNLKKLDRQSQYFIFLLPKDYGIFRTTRNFQKIVADFTWYGFAEQFKFPKLLNQYQLDLVHFPHFNIPIFYNGKFVVTIHDLIHQHHSMKRATTLDPFTFKLKQIGYRKVFKTALLKSQNILVPSKSVEQLLIKEWKITQEKITITPEAVDDKIFSIANKMKPDKIKMILKKFNIESPYIFYVGNAHPHKNIEGLIKAFLKIREKKKNLRLVLAGYDHYFWQSIQKLIAEGAKKDDRYKDIILTGYIDDEQLVALYKDASLFVMPSLEEGFGIPILEAFACGCAVVSSRNGSLPEVGGDVSLYFNPYNVNDMADKISEVMNNVKLRNELVEKGKKRVGLFSWEKLAKQTLEVYGNAYSFGS